MNAAQINLLDFRCNKVEMLGKTTLVITYICGFA